MERPHTTIGKIDIEPSIKPNYTCEDVDIKTEVRCNSSLEASSTSPLLSSKSNGQISLGGIMSCPGPNDIGLHKSCSAETLHHSKKTHIDETRANGTDGCEQVDNTKVGISNGSARIPPPRPPRSFEIGGCTTTKL